MKDPNTHPEERAGSGKMFDSIAPRYDLVNRVISLGLDQAWRRSTVRSLSLSSGSRVLDVATGTADLALMVASLEPGVSVVGLDPSGRMLEIAAEKIRRAGFDERISLVQGDAEELPLESNGFDGACVAFGIRNVPDRPRALAEMARVTRPGGRLAVLELSEPRAGWLSPLARFYVHELVPRLGSLLSGAAEYRYLERSIAAFPPAREFCDVISASGWRDVEARPLNFGVCHLYTARRAHA
jgi:demethylmenaquinone methyltransferase/2-methoxy-6-polyprenyl-1,4-benzoquinol methylase